MLRYIDFVPRQISEPGLFSPGEHEDFDAALRAANDWLAKNRVRLVSIETVVLPNIWSRWETGPADASLVTSSDNPNRWHQFIRCWYLDEQSGDQPMA